MEIRNLVAFLQVAVTKNFTQAAKILGYSQSNMSMLIQSLEKEIGVKLFDRIGHRISLTQYGEELVPYAQSIVSTAIQIQNFQSSPKSMGGTLKVGIVESLFEIAFKETIQEYHKHFKNVKVELIVDGTSDLQEAAKLGKIDIACIIDKKLPISEWNSLYSHEAKIVMVSNSQDELANKDDLSILDISNREFILMEDPESYTFDFKNCIASNNIEIIPFLKLQSCMMACEIIKSGMYLSVLPIYSVNKFIESGELSIINTPEFDLTQYVQVAVYKNKILTPQINGFVEAIVKVLNSKFS